MVAHLWANQAQDEARNGGGTLYFEGATIYSYGDHFPIARHAERKGKRCILFTTRGYSVTTERHINYTRRAIESGALVFNVPDPTSSNPREGFQGYCERVKSLKEAYIRARGRKPDIFRQIGETVKEANAYAAFYGLRSRLKMPANEEAIGEECAKIKAREERRQKREAAKRRKQEEEGLRTLAKHIEEWKNGERDACPLGAGAIFLRIRGEDLETSAGATVPLDHAKRAFRFIKCAKEAGHAWERNGQEIRLGHFSIDRIDPDGTVHAGCHTVAFDEIQRVAALAGVD